jgi:hypothetical protein
LDADLWPIDVWKKLYRQAVEGEQPEEKRYDNTNCDRCRALKARACQCAHRDLPVWRSDLLAETVLLARQSHFQGPGLEWLPEFVDFTAIALLRSVTFL